MRITAPALARFSPIILDNVQHIEQHLDVVLLPTTLPFESISFQVGYEDTTACRKVFVKVMGLTPVQFRRRFCS